MTRTLTIALGAMLLMAGWQTASASCAGDAAETRQECLRDAGRDRDRVRDCSASYRDDLAECHRYDHQPMMHAPPPHR